MHGSWGRPSGPRLVALRTDGSRPSYVEHGLVSQGTRSMSRATPARLVVAIIVAFGLLLSAMTSAEAASVPRKFAGLVLDAKSGKVLYESAADDA